MPRQSSGQEHIRKLGKTGSPENPSYYVTLPIDIVRKMKWRDGQKLIVNYQEDNNSVTIEDWQE